MYKDTVTLFNRYESKLGDAWFPTILRNVNLNIDKASVVARYGDASRDNAIMNVKYSILDGKTYVAGKEYLPPKEWDGQTNDRLARTITFASGEDFDFFVLGEYPDAEPINDDDFDGGFFEHMARTRDFVFVVTGCAPFSVIPHFEITGR